MEKVLKICTNKWEHQSREKRELSVYQGCGDEVVVLAKGDCADFGREDCVDGFKVLRCSTRPISCLPAQINRVLSVGIWAKKARDLHPTVITGHDLSGVAIGWLSTLFVSSKRKPKLIYHSHEFEIGRNKKRNKLQVWLVTEAERFLIKRCAFSIMVNDSIADEVKRIHKLKDRPIVVRSTPELWCLEEEKISSQRKEFFEKLPKVKSLIMYHGLLTKGRGIEDVFEVLVGLPEVGLIVLGNSDSPEYLDSLKRAIDKLGIRERVQFYPAVPLQELGYYIAAVDVEMILGKVPTKSYYFGLPNKFFESIQSETPIVSYNLPEIKRIIEEYRIGLTCPIDDISKARDCVSQLLINEELYKTCKEGLKIAKHDLCWENEQKVLAAAYSKLINL